MSGHGAPIYPRLAVRRGSGFYTNVCACVSTTVHKLKSSSPLKLKMICQQSVPFSSQSPSLCLESLFSSVRGMGPSASVQFSSKTPQALTRIDLVGSFGSDSVQSIDFPIVWEEQF